MTINEHDLIGRLVSQALEEDLDSAGDITSRALFSDGDSTAAMIKSKSEGVLSGAMLLAPVFSRCDERIAIDLTCRDGDKLQPGTVICTVKGPVRGILAGERTALNFLQRLSGIATLTARFKAAIGPRAHARLLDTRKTTPLLRYLEKMAVLHGGGCNHRFGLYDMMLIKDTHIKRAGGVSAALEKAMAFRAEAFRAEAFQAEAFRESGSDRVPAIEIEVQSVEEFLTAVERGPDRIMLDNMPPDEMQRCVAHRDNMKSAVELEASGNISLATIAAVAQTGVDFISVGALTHSAPALDIHLVIL